MKINLKMLLKSLGGGDVYILKAGRGRQICEFEANLVYLESSRTARATNRQNLSQKIKINK